MSSFPKDKSTIPFHNISWSSLGNRGVYVSKPKSWLDGRSWQSRSQSQISPATPPLTLHVYHWILHFRRPMFRSMHRIPFKDENTVTNGSSNPFIFCEFKFQTRRSNSSKLADIFQWWRIFWTALPSSKIVPQSPSIIRSINMFYTSINERSYVSTI